VPQALLLPRIGDASVIRVLFPRDRAAVALMHPIIARARACGIFARDSHGAIAFTMCIGAYYNSLAWVSNGAFGSPYNRITKWRSNCAGFCITPNVV